MTGREGTMTDWSWIPPRESGAVPRLIETGEAMLETVVAGPEDADTVAVLLHGFPELNISWRFQIPMLVARGIRVYAPNLRGYGASSRPKGVDAYHIDRLTQDVAGLIDAARAETGASRTILVAHDWGGAIAWDFAIRALRPLDALIVCNMPHPHTFARAVATSRAQRRKSWYVAFFQLPWLPEAMMRAGGARAVREAFVGTAAHPENFPPSVLEAYARNALRPGGMTAMLNYYRSAVRTRQRMTGGDGRVDTPTLLLWGAADMALGEETLEGIESYVPDLSLEKLPGMSHWVQQDAPDAVNAHMTRWLDAQGL